MILTYKYKLYKTKKTKNIDNLLNISRNIYNHCIALHKRYYRMFKKHLNMFQLQKHLTKLKKLPKYQYWSKVPAQSIQAITERIDEAYKLFFKGSTEVTPSKKHTVELAAEPRPWQRIGGF